MSERDLVQPEAEGMPLSFDESEDVIKHQGLVVSEHDPAHSDPEAWRGLFHSYDDCVNAPPLRFAIGGFLQEQGVTLIGGLAGHGKTFLMLSMVRSLLEGTPLFDYSGFAVEERAERVIYLIPESSLSPFWHRLQLFQLDEHVKTGRLLIRTLSHHEPLVSLTDPRLLEAANGAHLFLDTAVRFMEGDESAASEAKVFAQRLFNLQSAGARTITGAHHSPKSFDNADYMTLENILRGSGDIGAMLVACWGVRQIDEPSNRIYVQNVKGRDFQACGPFVIEGRPHIDERGNFSMVKEPGTVDGLPSRDRSKPGPKAMPDDNERRARARELHFTGGHSIRVIAEQMKVNKSKVERWVK
jgi:hypothetical protein